MKTGQLLAEVEDVLRTMPSRDDAASHTDEIIPWLGRAAAVLERWNTNPDRRLTITTAVERFHSDNLHRLTLGYSELTRLLYQARADLRMEVGLVSVVVQEGQVFDYFDELRKVIQTARSDVFFVDPYLDAEFVSRYLRNVASGVAVRLLGHKRITTLVPAVDLLAQQSGLAIQVRSSNDLHDRYLFVDRSACYLSGASFKDGAKNAPAVLTQITDAFQAMLNTYERLWDDGKVER